MKFSLQDIKPYPQNAKEHPAEQIELIAHSLKKWGWRQPIVVNKDRVIIAGHGRLLAYQKYPDQTKEPWVVSDDGKTLLGEPESTPFANEDEEKAYRLADNQLNQISGYDNSILIPELRELDTNGIDIALLGFSGYLLDGENPGEPPLTKEPTEVRTVLGDVYQIGNHRVMCGDSIDSKHVEILMESEKAELLFTSPPYSDMRDYEGGKDLAVENLCKFVSVFGEFAEYQVINLGIQRRDNNIVCYWDEYIKEAAAAGYKFLSWSVWNRETARTIGQQTAFFPIAHEWIFVFGKKFKDINKTREKAEYTKSDKRGYKSRRQKDGSTSLSSVGDTSHPLTEMTSVFTSQPELSNAIRDLHPATFPVKFPREYIKAITSVGDVVIEPFLGSGSTLIACEMTWRSCYSMELEPKYVDVAIQRWVDYTGIEKVIKNGQEIDWPKTEHGTPNDTDE